MAQDPICGMQVDERTAISAQKDGQSYYFCCEGCRRKFLDPTAAGSAGGCCHGPTLVTLEGGLLAGGHPRAATDDGRSYRYICPMCPGVGSDEPAACPVCGMALELAAPVLMPGAVKYTCPMHPQVEQDHPGSCPLCGMALEASSVATDEDDPELRSMQRHLRWATLFNVPLLLIAMGPMLGLPIDSWLGGPAVTLPLQALLCAGVVLGAGWPILQRAWQSVRSGHGNMFTLIGLGTLTAFLYSGLVVLAPDWVPAAFREHGHVAVYFEAAASIITLVLLGQVLELRARKRTGNALRELVSLAPPTARRVADGQSTQVPLGDVRVGDLLEVLPGDRVPVDGEVIEGESHVDESMLTGESEPAHKQAGDSVVAGTVNQTGAFRMRARHVGQETLLAQIVQLVAQAQRSRAPIQRLADRVAGWFVPVVVAAALLTFVCWAVWGPADSKFAHALVHAVSVLIIACPCALGLATPMSIVVGLGRGAKEGILVRDAAILETVERVNTLVVDKTGTLTEGHPTLAATQLLRHDMTETEALHWAASLEQSSEHPLGHALLKAARERGLKLSAVTQFVATPGAGVRGTVAGRAIAVGKWTFVASAIKDTTTPPPDPADSATGAAARSVIYLAMEGVPSAAFFIEDRIRPSAASALASLRRLGVDIQMMTGDNARVAGRVAHQLGIEHYRSEVSPRDKHDHVQKLKTAGRVVAMAGDGINDAPALAVADVGMAMGTGTDIAMQSAGVTLLRGNLDGIAKAIRLSHLTMRNIRQNLFFAFAYNALGIPLAAGILVPLLGDSWRLNPMLAALAMSLSSVSVIANALRLQRANLRS